MLEKIDKKLWNSQFEGLEEKGKKYFDYAKWYETLYLKDDEFVYKEINLISKLISFSFSVLSLPFGLIIFGLYYFLEFSRSVKNTFTLRGSTIYKFNRKYVRKVKNGH